MTNSPSQKLSTNRFWIVCVVLVFAALVRLAGVAPAALPYGELADAIGGLIDRGDVSLADLAGVANVDRADVLRFDSDAIVYLAPGVDGQPGQAGKDDDFDGVADNAGEMGAVGSDDQCLAPWSDDYTTVSNIEKAVPISNGAFVVVPDAVDSDASERFIVYANVADYQWAWMIIPR